MSLAGQFLQAGGGNQLRPNPMAKSCHPSPYWRQGLRSLLSPAQLAIFTKGLQELNYLGAIICTPKCWVEISHSCERVTGELASQHTKLPALRNQAENVDENQPKNKKTQLIY